MKNVHIAWIIFILSHYVASFAFGLASNRISRFVLKLVSMTFILSAVSKMVSAFRKHTGCTDAIFATQEIIARYISEGSTVRMWLFDLQNAFDSVAFLVLLGWLFSIGVNDMETYQELVCRWNVLCSCGWCFINNIPYLEGCPPRIDPVTNPLQHCNGPTPEDLGVLRSGA